MENKIKRLYLSYFSHKGYLNVSDILSYPEYIDMWNWDALSKSKGITYKDVILNETIIKRWNWVILSQYVTLSFSDLFTYDNKKLYWYYLSQNSNIFLEDVFSSTIIDRFDFLGLSQNPNISIKIIKDNPKYIEKWVWGMLSENKSITFKDIVDHPEFYKRWDWDKVLKFRNLKLSVILNLPDNVRKYINMDTFSYSKKLKLSEVKKHSELFGIWAWYPISANCIIDPKEVKKDPEFYKYLNMRNFSQNPNISSVDVIKNKKFFENLDWFLFSSHHSIKPEQLVKMDSKDVKMVFNDRELFQNINLNHRDFSLIKDIADIELLSVNNNITPYIVTQNQNLDWLWPCLYYNKMNRIPSIRLIERWWRKKYLIRAKVKYHPDSLFVKNDIKDHFEKMKKIQERSKI